MGRDDDRRRGPEPGWRREGVRWSSESARRSERGDEQPPRTLRNRQKGRRELEPGERGRYRVAEGRDAAGDEWPEGGHRGDSPGEVPQGDRDAWSERQSGPYRSPVTGRAVTESEYREETRWHRSHPRDTE